MKAVILAGGSGTRLWPRSRSVLPKQFLDLIEPGRSLLQETVERIRPLVAPQDVLVVTSQAFAGRVAEQLPEVPRANILGEPMGRGSAPAIGWAAATIQQRWGGDVMISLHSDHHIAKPGVFRTALAAAAEVARRGNLVTLGVVPTRPHTGLGHVQRGESLPDANGLPAYRIARFVEKPDLSTAEAYTASGEYFWNSGIFVWQTATLLEEMAGFMPGLAGSLAELQRSMGTAEEGSTLAEVWPRLAIEQIDYGVMEHTRRGAVLPVDMGWSDIGDWNSLAEILAGHADENGNIVSGEFAGLDNHDSVVVSGAGRLIAAIGLDNMVVVDTHDILLICPRHRNQDVRRIVERLRAENKSHLL